MGRLTKCIDGGDDVATCALGDFDRLQQLVKGMYSLFLPSWLASYPASHIMVLNFDEYRCVQLRHLQLWGPAASGLAAAGQPWQAVLQCKSMRQLIQSRCYSGKKSRPR